MSKQPSPRLDAIRAMREANFLKAARVEVDLKVNKPAKPKPAKPGREMAPSG